MNNKKTLGMILLFAIIASLIWVWTANKADAPENITETTNIATSTNNQNPTAVKSSNTSPAPVSASKVSITKDGYFIVQYFNSGFSPRSLEIKKGKSVRFINNSDKAMRIFADDQTSQTYRTLNQSKTIGKGASYDFTFVDEGNWSYHNENNLSDKGVVVVVR